MTGRSETTGDRLAQIEARGWSATSFARLDYPPTPEEARGDAALIRGLASDVLALVEIAKAAQPMARLPIPLSVDERTEWLTNQNRLRDALARLGSGAAEEDA